MGKWDSVIMVDWSAGNDRGPTPKADAIWATQAREGRAQRPVYLRNRQMAEDWIINAVAAERAQGRRVLLGFDFPFGYPKGFAEAVTGSADVFSLWDDIETRINDAPGANNRFDVAGGYNALFPGVGPFWGNGLKRDILDLPRKGTARRDHMMPERREAETRAKGAFPLWQMSGAGSVGGQALMGIAMLNRLRRLWADDVAIWPFETMTKGVGIVEIWPSLFVGDAPDGWIKDAWQVHEVARAVSALPDAQLDQMLNVEAPEEGWIFGLGHEALLQSDDPSPPPLSNDCFALPAGVSWTRVDEALDMLKARLGPVTTTETVALSAALGRITAAPIFASRSHPPKSNAAVDGYGFAGGVSEGAHTLPLVAGAAAAGHAADAVPAGSAIRILTGAQLPDGVDTIVLQEDVTLTAETVTFKGPIKPGANTRAAAEDIAENAQILPAGRKITPGDIAVCASTGVASLTVRKLLRVGVLSTGDELAEIGSEVGDDRIFDANRPMLLGLVAGLGFEAVDLGRAADSRVAVQSKLNDGASRCDVILTSGGASAGEEDHVSAVLTEGGAINMWRIAIKPGRPLALGMWQGVPVFGLPGNPVAAYVCTLVFGRPAMSLLAGAGWTPPEGQLRPAAFTKRKKPGRQEYFRARLNADGAVEIFKSEGSGRVSGISWADGLVALPHEEAEVQPGDLVTYIPWSGFGL
ncbi:MAG: molybdopterin molybdenumtransferase MoeA [Rhodobacteraceae bacterium]|nr:molybdopterin molybdenumtransferase MoeA [Paracoccaceae bacterium]